MQKKYLPSIFVLLFLANFGPQYKKHEIFLSKEVSKNLLINEKKITYLVDSQEVGFISFTNFFSLYIIHSFYIYPVYRNNGLGRKLLLHTCNYIKKLGGRKIYIQPGPFELVEETFTNIADPRLRKAKLVKLILFYKNVSFKSVYPVTQKCASFLYKILQISENSSYLMIKKI